MMEDKHEDCTSEDIGYMRHLLRDVEDWGSMNSVCDKVVRRGTIKTSNDYKSKDSSENLKAFWVFNVSEWKEEWEHPKDNDTEIVWIKDELLLPLVSIWVDQVRHGWHETCGSTRILEAHCTIHVNDKEYHDCIFEPCCTETFNHDSKFHFLPDVVPGLLVFGILAIELSPHYGSGIDFLREQGVLPITWFVSIGIRYHLNYESWSYVGDVRCHYQKDQREYRAQTCELIRVTTMNGITIILHT